MFSSKMREISYNFLRSFMLKAIRPYDTVSIPSSTINSVGGLVIIEF